VVLGGVEYPSLKKKGEELTITLGKKEKKQRVVSKEKRRELFFPLSS